MAKRIISGEQFEEFIKGNKKVDEFEGFLLELNKEYEEFLSIKLTQKTVRKHIQISDLFINFLCFDNGISNFNEITVGIANSYFRKWFRSKIDPSFGETELKGSIKKFIQFLHVDKRITFDDKVLKSFKIKPLK